MIINEPLAKLSGIGPQAAKLLAKLNLHTPLDLLFHLPKTYQDRTRIYPLSQLRVGLHVLVEGEITKVEIIQGRGNMLICHIADKSGQLALRFFHFHRNQLTHLQTGQRLRAFGEVRLGRRCFEMTHPEYRVISGDQIVPVESTLTPVYPNTEGLSQSKLRRLVAEALKLVDETTLSEYIPAGIRNKLQFPTLLAALKFVHYPPTDVAASVLLEGQHPMQQRLAFEELLSHRLSMRRLRQNRQHGTAPALHNSQDLQQQFLQRLPFPLTTAQQRVIEEITADLNKTKPMLRLLQGDVGSGKTIVSVAAALQAVAAGYQAAVMAPTELLAEQHLQNFSRWLTPLGITVGFLANKLTAKQKREMQESCANGTAQIMIGTHALFQEGIEFNNLSLVIIDEQHRFGVEQRRALQQKGSKAAREPHQLVMTATPIPRTLAMTAYADLDLSILDELPPGRTPVKTVLVSNQRRDEVIARVQAACTAGRQTYWVCTLIEESEVLTCRAAEDTTAQLQAELPNLKIGLVHGRMKASDKNLVMTKFANREIDLLVATTVIEVGVDVPNASLMIIENPERLGLSQLHQLRGRVGRGSAISFCVLLYQSPLSQLARTRLQIIRDSNDGFKIAEEDLKIRGPGEVLGTRQTGEMNFRIASLIRDQQLLPLVQQTADLILANHPECIEPLIQRWIGKAEDYAKI